MCRFVARQKSPEIAPLDHSPAVALALAYAPRDVRPVFDDLFALDRRLADAVRQASEPIIAQMKLAWWRDRFAQSPTEWPKGEPLLARLTGWNADLAKLGWLVDGWEELLAEGALSDSAIIAFGEGHADAWSVVMQALGHAGSPPAEQCARLWAFADLAAHCSSAEDAERVRTVANDLLAWPVPRLPRALRPFAVLGALGRRSLRSAKPVLAGPGDFLAAVRAGMLGR